MLWTGTLLGELTSRRWPMLFVAEACSTWWQQGSRCDCRQRSSRAYSSPWSGCARRRQRLPPSTLWVFWAWGAKAWPVSCCSAWPCRSSQWTPMWAEFVPGSGGSPW
eukprot:jgi/Astpho2/6668/gw1.00101.176.1_t